LPSIILRISMKIKEKKVNNTTLVLEVSMKESDYIKSVNLELSNYQKKMNLPGFRVGKVPMGLVKKKYQLAIKVEEINKILSDAIKNYISDNKILILGGPIPIEKNIDFKNEVDYVFQYELGLQPTINLSVAEKSKIDYLVIKPESKEIQDHIESLRKRYGKITQCDTIQKEDMLNVFLQELINDAPKQDGVSNTSSLLVDKIHDQSIKNKFLKLKKSETIVFPIKKAFNNISDLASMLNIPKEEAEKIDSNFSCTINEINRLDPAKLDVDFFKKVYPKEKSIKTKKEFEKLIKDELSQRYLKDSDRKLFNDASMLFMEKVKIDLPDEFLKKWLKMNAKKEFLESEFEKEYENYVKYLSWQLIENKICIDHSIKITNDKLMNFTKEHVLEQMKNYGNVNMPDKEINGIVTNILQNKKEAEKMTNELVLIEMVQYFKNQMKIQRKTVTLDEFIKLANNQK